MYIAKESFLGVNSEAGFYSLFEDFINKRSRVYVIKGGPGTGKSTLMRSIGKQAEQVPAGSDGLVMLPHLAGSNAPDVNAKAKGVWFGVTLQHTRAHFMRAVMESLGYIVRRNIDTLADMGIQVKTIRSLGGGAKSAVWNQIKADINQISLETVNSVEAASLGAAILAGRAVGIFEDIPSAVASMVRVKDHIQPNPDNKAAYEQGYAMYQKLFRELTDCFEPSL